MKTMIIAEVGNNHNGSIERAKKIVNELTSAGAEIIKFQIRNLETLYRNSKDCVEDLGVEYTKDLLNKYSLSISEHSEIAHYCSQKGVEYMCTPWDLESVEVLEDIGVKRYKVASADFDNIFLINRILDTKKPLILSTGMSHLNEIKSMITYLNENNANFSLLHCNSTYPAPFLDIELNFIRTLKKLHSTIGYSSHERGISIAVAAVAIGADIIEKHITLDKQLEGPDHQASITPTEFSHMIKMIQEVEEAMGTEEVLNKKLSQGALLNKENLGKSIVASHKIKKGKILSEEDITVKSPGSGISPLHYSNLIGKKIHISKNKDDFIYLSDFDTQKREDLNFKKFNLWGIPVRPHDARQLNQGFNARLYEFHISYNDLDRGIRRDQIIGLENKKIIVHAPELFKNSELLNLCSDNQELLDNSIKSLQDVCDYCDNLAQLLEYEGRIKVVANVGGFSTHSFKSEDEKSHLYDKVIQSIDEVSQVSTKIIPQNMAPFPWHFGGQRYQNIFIDSDEIVSFCKRGYNICLDTAHLSMNCKFFNKKFEDEFLKLLPYSDHLHLSDADGLNGEGVKLGTGDIDFKFVMNNISKDQSFIVETWQGHKNGGAGFFEDLRYLDTLLI